MRPTSIVRGCLAGDACGIAAARAAGQAVQRPHAAPRPTPLIAPFSAHYLADWKGITVGYQRPRAAGRTQSPDITSTNGRSQRAGSSVWYTATMSRRQSWFERRSAITCGPEKYRAEEGTVQRQPRFRLGQRPRAAACRKINRWILTAQGRNARPHVDPDRGHARSEKRRTCRRPFISSTRTSSRNSSTPRKARRISGPRSGSSTPSSSRASAPATTAFCACGSRRRLGVRAGSGRADAATANSNSRCGSKA